MCKKALGSVIVAALTATAAVAPIAVSAADPPDFSVPSSPNATLR